MMRQNDAELGNNNSVNANMNQISKHEVADQLASPTPAHDKFDAGQQTTLLRPINCVGIALHSGKKVSLTLKPADADSGVVFYRTDVPGSKRCTPLPVLPSALMVIASIWLLSLSCQTN